MDLTIIIPVGGKARRFYDAGYTIYKPFLPVGDKTMIEKVYDNLKIKGCKFIFSVRPQDATKFMDLFPTEQIVVDNEQDGAAGGVLIARRFITDKPLLISNSDELIDADILDFVSTDLDGRIMTFNNDNPKWSYAKEHEGMVTEVAEKVVISSHATSGLYYFKHGTDFIKSADRMVEDGYRVNGEFYVCPTYNFMPRHKKIGIYEINQNQMHGLGVPEDYERYINDLHNK